MVEVISSGKVREIYDVGDGKLVIVTTDRISAFDSILPATIPHKGEILNLLSSFWFHHTEDICPNHLISIRDSDMPREFQKPEYYGRCMLVKKLQMLPIECIVRGYITGSGWDSYKETGKVCGIRLPEGLQKSEKLPSPIYTPTTKASTGHDEHISFQNTITILSELYPERAEEYATQLRDKSIELYSTCLLYALSKGIIIADTKFEFGIDEDGQVVLADEMLTPDSSRFWDANEYEIGKSQKSYDKQFLRDWLKENGYAKNPVEADVPYEVVHETTKKYIKAYELLTGYNF